MRSEPGTSSTLSQLQAQAREVQSRTDKLERAIRKQQQEGLVDQQFRLEREFNEVLGAVHTVTWNVAATIDQMQIESDDHPDITPFTHISTEIGVLIARMSQPDLSEPENKPTTDLAATFDAMDRPANLWVEMERARAIVRPKLMTNSRFAEIERSTAGASQQYNQRDNADAITLDKISEAHTALIQAQDTNDQPISLAPTVVMAQDSDMSMEDDDIDNIVLPPLNEFLPQARNKAAEINAIDDRLGTLLNRIDKLEQETKELKKAVTEHRGQERNKFARAVEKDYVKRYEEAKQESEKLQQEYTALINHRAAVVRESHNLLNNLAQYQAHNQSSTKNIDGSSGTGGDGLKNAADQLRAVREDKQELLKVKRALEAALPWHTGNDAALQVMTSISDPFKSGTEIANQLTGVTNLITQLTAIETALQQLVAEQDRDLKKLDKEKKELDKISKALNPSAKEAVELQQEYTRGDDSLNAIREELGFGMMVSGGASGLNAVIQSNRTDTLNATIQPIQEKVKEDSDLLKKFKARMQEYRYSKTSDGAKLDLWKPFDDTWEANDKSLKWLDDIGFPISLISAILKVIFTVAQVCARLANFALTGIGTLTEYGLKGVAKAMEFVGQALAKPLALVAEKIREADIQQNIGAQIGWRLLGVVCLVPKLLGSGLNITASCLRSTGDFIHEASTLVSKVALLVSKPWNKTYWVQAAFSVGKTLTTAIGVATNTANQVGSELREIANHGRIPILQQILNAIGSFIQSLSAGLEGSVEGGRQLLSGNKSLGAGVAKGGWETAVQNVKSIVEEDVTKRQQVSVGGVGYDRVLKTAQRSKQGEKIEVPSKAAVDEHISNPAVTQAVQNIANASQNSPPTTTTTQTGPGLTTTATTTPNPPGGNSGRKL